VSIAGPEIGIGFIFAGGRKLRMPRNLGPCSDGGEYMAALTDAEVEDVKFLRLPEAQAKDLAEEAP
jgi:hypothetical protein